MSVRKVAKILHELGSVGYLGGIVALLVMLATLPDPSDTARFAQVRVSMAAISHWVVFPSVFVVLISGFLSMMVVSAYQNAGWVWAKLATGILVFEGTLVSVLGPMRRAGERAAAVLAGDVPGQEFGTTMGSEQMSLWILCGVALFNVVVGVWRPRMRQRRTQKAEA